MLAVMVPLLPVIEVVKFSGPPPPPLCTTKACSGFRLLNRMDVGFTERFGMPAARVSVTATSIGEDVVAPETALMRIRAVYVPPGRVLASRLA